MKMTFKYLCISLYMYILVVYWFRFNKYSFYLSDICDM